MGRGRARRWWPALLVAVTLAAGLSCARPTASETPCPPGGVEHTYVVLHPEGTAAAAVDDELRATCGTRVEYYAEIGVAVARSSSPEFARRLGEHRVYSAGRDIAGRAGSNTVAPGTPTPPPGRLAGAQWDMRAIRAPEANAVDPGRRSVTVGVLDTGVETSHPALRESLARDRSTGCDTGAPRPEEAEWTAATSDHGTHVAATIAGRDPAAGFTGVAPGVSVASVKVSGDNDLICPEGAVCGRMWVARQGFAVVNNSYFVDPGLFWCREAPGDAAAFEAVRRATRFAQDAGTTVVASTGNDGFDATTQTTDPVRTGMPVGPGCAVLPAGLDGVVAVSSIGATGALARYSTYGLGYVDVTAPGGDTGVLPVPGQGPACPISAVTGGYAAMCGTSMASPHAAGVAALLAGRVTPERVPELLGAQADALACPVGLPPGPSGSATCTGPEAGNSFFGRGRVDALDAVTAR